MADNQSKNLPKADRQALNEVGQPLECPALVLGPIHYLGRNELQPGSCFSGLIQFHPFLLIWASPGPILPLAPPLLACSNPDFAFLFFLLSTGHILPSLNLILTSERLALETSPKLGPADTAKSFSASLSDAQPGPPHPDSGPAPLISLLPNPPQ